MGHSLFFSSGVIGRRWGFSSFINTKQSTSDHRFSFSIPTIPFSSPIQSRRLALTVRICGSELSPLNRRRQNSSFNLKMHKRLLRRCVRLCKSSARKIRVCRCSWRGSKDGAISVRGARGDGRAVEGRGGVVNYGLHVLRTRHYASAQISAGSGSRTVMSSTALDVKRLSRSPHDGITAEIAGMLKWGRWANGMQ